MKRLFRLLCVVWAIHLAVAASARGAEDLTPVPIPENLPAPVFDAPPRLATTRAEFDRLKAQPDFSALSAATVKASNALLKKPTVLPNGYGEWSYYYACADDGTRLKALNAENHQCPKCDKVYSDARTRAAYRTLQHHAAEKASETLGRAYLYSGDERFAAEAKRILLGLATEYPTYPARIDRWGKTGDAAKWGGRRFVQSLDEAVGIIKLARAYDLARSSPVWSDDDHRLVEENLFGLTAQTLLAFNQDISNHQTWYNAGLMAIASVLGDAALARRVLTMRGGYYDQLNRSVGSDGLWYEGAMVYHDYALEAMREIVDAGRRMHLPLHEAPKLRAMLLGPLSAGYPDGTFPVINDSDPAHLRLFDDDYAWARAVFGEPDFGSQPAIARSQNLADAGLAILRQGTAENASCVFLDYGLHGGGHGHFDKLGITLFANGREWLLDPGRLGYNHKEYLTWAKQTAAHNTVSRGGKNQQSTTGRLLWLQEGDGFSACAAQSDGAYPGVLLRRYLLLTPQYLLDVFEVESKDAAQTDWLAHANADALRPVDDVGASTPQVPGREFGYQHFSDGQKWNAPRASRWVFLSDSTNADAPRLRLWLADDSVPEIFTAFGIGYTVAQKTPTLIRRLRADSTRFVTVYDLSGRGDSVRNVQTQGDAVLVETAQGARRLTFSPDGVLVK